AYSGVTIMPVQVLDANGAGQDSDIIMGLVWAADHGADLILMGFSNPGYSQNLQDAIDYAWSRGAVLVAATGNDGSSAASYPAGDSSATNDVIAGRLARNADRAGTREQTGNGRLNLARAIADTSTDGVTPVGAPGGGPLVGPYVIAAGAPSVAITFPTATGYNAAGWPAGCGTASTDDFCGTAAAGGSGGVLSNVKYSIQQGVGNWWNGTGFAGATEVQLTP